MKGMDYRPYLDMHFMHYGVWLDKEMYYTFLELHFIITKDMKRKLHD